MNWFASELHCHTLHSDGAFTVDELKKEAKQHELDSIALTDHNTVSGWAEIANETDAEAITVLKGIEWTTFFGHMLVMDCPVFVDWRDALPDNIDEKISQIRSHGGLVGIAHPYELGSPMCTGCYWDYHVNNWANVNFIEVWSEAFPAIKLSNYRAIALWTSVLDNGYHIAATYGKDWHRKSDESEPSACTYIGTERTGLNATEMKNALLYGRTAITMGPKFTMEAEQDGKVFPLGSTVKSGNTNFNFSIDLAARKKHWERFDFNIETIRLITNGGTIVKEILLDSNSNQIEFYANAGWYRGELWGSVMGNNCCIAMTSPIYFE